MAIPSTSYDVNSGDDTTLAVSITDTQTEGIILSPVNRNGVDEAWATLSGCVVEISQEIEGEKRVELMGMGNGTVNADFSVTLLSTDVGRGGSRTGTGFVFSGTGQKFNSGARVRLVNHHGNFNKKANLDRVNTWSAAQTIANGIKWLFGSASNWIYGSATELFFKDTLNAQVSLSQLTAAAGVDTKVLVSSDDTTAGFLNGKLVAGKNVTFTEGSPAGNETLTIAAGPVDSTELTISSGAITVTANHHTLDTESDNSGDDLVTINGGTANSVIYLRMENENRLINIKDGDGNIIIPGGDLTISDPDEIYMFVFLGSSWRFLGSRGFHVGDILNFGNDTAPVDSLMCYGQAVSRTTYSNLFDKVGTAYGSGNGTTTFNVPDYRGRFALGQDDMGGSAANRVTHANADTLGAAEGSETASIQHTHTVDPDNTAINRAGGGSNSYGYDADTGGVTGNMSANATPNVMNPYLTSNFIIKI